MHDIYEYIKLFTVSSLFLGLNKYYQPKTKYLLIRKTLLVIYALTIYLIDIHDLFGRHLLRTYMWIFSLCTESFAVAIHSAWSEMGRKRIFTKLQLVDRYLSVKNINWKTGYRISLLSTLIISLNAILFLCDICDRSHIMTWFIILRLTVAYISLLTSCFEIIWRVFLVLLIKFRMDLLLEELSRLFPIYRNAEEKVILPNVLLIRNCRRTKLPKLLKVYKMLADTSEDITENMQFCVSLNLLC